MFNFLNENIYFYEFLYCFEYEKLVRNLILKYKFSNYGYLSNLFVNVILNNKKINEIFKSYDIMIPVPMNKIKKKIRGYNQTELIAKYIKINSIIKNIILFDDIVTTGLTINEISKILKEVGAKKYLF